MRKRLNECSWQRMNGGPGERRALRARVLAEPVYKPGFKMPFHALAFDTKSGKIYLLDGTSHAIVYEAAGDKSARGIVETLINKAISALHDDPLKSISERGN